MKAQTETVAAVISYSFCSGSLVLLNKLILHHLPYPSLVVSFQLTSTIFFIFTAKHVFGLSVDDLQWKFVVPYLYYIVAFSFGVFCNMKSLSMSNVETVIVFRALSPCLVALLDGIFLGREYPSMRSWSALALIVAGAIGYASFDMTFKTQGWSAYGWPTAYCLVIAFEMAYGKKIIKSVDLKTKSGPVLYTNLLGIWPMLMFAYIGGEPGKFSVDREGGKVITAGAIALLLLGCVVGTAIGYSSWWCRDRVSATSFTLIGVLNKCMTVLVNLMIWDKHAAPAGIASLALCLVGGAFYQQAPMRNATNINQSSSQAVAAAAEDVWESDLSGHGNTGASTPDEERASLLVEPSPRTGDGMKLRK